LLRLIAHGEPDTCVVPTITIAVQTFNGKVVDVVPARLILIEPYAHSEVFQFVPSKIVGQESKLQEMNSVLNQGIRLI
jgi:hypothetical protein